MRDGGWINQGHDELMTALHVDAVILACAISAGIHGALAPRHFGEGMGAGAGFVGATLLLAGLGAALTLRPSHLVVTGAAVVFAGLLGSYALAVTTGVPVLHADVEPVDGLGLFTKAVEAVGLASASTLLWRRSAGVSFLQPKGT